jgi:hypothetical protein
MASVRTALAGAGDVAISQSDALIEVAIGLVVLLLGAVLLMAAGRRGGADI